MEDPISHGMKPVRRILEEHPEINAITDLGRGYIFLGERAFAHSTLLEKVQILGHESIIHKGFKRLDDELDPQGKANTVRGSVFIHSTLTNILKQSVKFK